VLNVISPPPPVLVTLPEKIVASSRLVAMKLAAVPDVAIVEFAIAEKVTAPDAKEPAGGLAKLFVVNIVLLELRKISLAVELVVPAFSRLIIASPIVFLRVVSEMVIVILIILDLPLRLAFLGIFHCCQ
jgi:hypothetical protein